MKLKTLILLIALVFMGCNAVDTKVSSQTSNANHAPPQQPNDGVKRVTSAELDELMKQGKVFVVDVRNQTMYDAGHIRGAKLIPFGEIANHLNEFPKDKQIVTYCS